MAPLDAGGAIPGSDVVAPKVVRPSVATPVFLLLSGLPGRCCSVGSCGCGGGVTIAAGLLATGTWLHPGDAVDATAVRPFFLVSAATTVGAGAAAVAAGAATLVTGAAAVAAGAAAVRAGAAAVGAGAPTFGTAFFGPFAPVEACWPGCGAEPSVPSSLSVPPGAFFGPFAPVEACWPEAVVPASPCAAEPLELGSATATAPPAPPIGRAAASTQTPAAKRKCETTLPATITSIARPTVLMMRALTAPPRASRRAGQGRPSRPGCCGVFRGGR